LGEFLLAELLGDRVAQQVVDERVPPYFKPPGDKVLGELLGESLLVELFGK
jgi:hypothetical protein